MKKIIKYCQENNLIFSINTNDVNEKYVMFDFVNYYNRSKRRFVIVDVEDVKKMSESKLAEYVLNEIIKRG